jgi:hypothetical protein
MIFQVLIPEKAIHILYSLIATINRFQRIKWKDPEKPQTDHRFKFFNSQTL